MISLTKHLERENQSVILILYVWSTLQKNGRLISSVQNTFFIQLLIVCQRLGKKKKKRKKELSSEICTARIQSSSLLRICKIRVGFLTEQIVFPANFAFELVAKKI